MIPLPVLGPAEAKAWDRRAEQEGIPLRALMECAGRGAAGVLASRLGDLLRGGVLVACGPGNNGGDGWVVARALHVAGAPVWVTSAGGRGGDLAGQVSAAARGSGVREVPPDGPWPNVALVVDALLGTGAQGAPREGIAALASRIADLMVPVVALDGPTGLDLGDGVQHGPLRAALTITFGGYRRGHLLARDEVGDVVVLDIGLPHPAAEWPLLFTEAMAAAAVEPFAATAHKGSRGRVVIVGGDEGMLGAARLAARAAFAAGAGLVHLVAPAASVAVASAAEPDLQTVSQPFEARPAARTLAVLQQADAVVVGPGLGRSPSRSGFVQEILAAAASAAVIVDADGLMAFAGQDRALGEILRGRRAMVTPHAGEFRALVPDLAAGTAADPWSAATLAAERLGAAVLLKGVPTVVAGGPGPVLTVAAGNPGLATGGSGDTLSGIVAALAGQGVDIRTAGAAAAHTLGEAADLAARRVSARSLRPMDVVAALPDVWRRLDLVRRAPPPPRLPILHELPAPARI